MNHTLDYYNQNAESFINGTKNADMHDAQDHFLSYLPKGASILDFGCGSGRDTRYFLEKGYQVSASDGSDELCRIASEYTGIKVMHLLFQELDSVSAYDGIWACASILHLSKQELIPVFIKMLAALKYNGIIYASFKYGTFEGDRNGRYFTDFTENTFKEFISEVPELKAEEYWITSDVRPGRGEEKWLNLIIRRSDIH